MIRRAFLSLTLLAAACVTNPGGGGTPPPSQPAKATSMSTSTSIKIQLVVQPDSATMAQRKDMQVGFEVVNVGTAPVDPKLDQSEMVINGQPSLNWSLVIGNGAREQKWYELPPGQKVERKWNLGESLFPKPGDYTLVMRSGGVESAPVKVKVTP